MCSHLEKYALECGGGLGFWNSVMRKSVTSKKKNYISSLCEYFMKVDGYEKDIYGPFRWCKIGEMLWVHGKLSRWNDDQAPCVMNRTMISKSRSLGISTTKFNVFESFLITNRIMSFSNFTLSPGTSVMPSDSVQMFGWTDLFVTL